MMRIWINLRAFRILPRCEICHSNFICARFVAITTHDIYHVRFSFLNSSFIYRKTNHSMPSNSTTDSVTV